MSSLFDASVCCYYGKNQAFSRYALIEAVLCNNQVFPDGSVKDKGWSDEYEPRLEAIAGLGRQEVDHFVVARAQSTQEAGEILEALTRKGVVLDVMQGCPFPPPIASTTLEPPPRQSSAPGPVPGPVHVSTVQSEQSSHRQSDGGAGELGPQGGPRDFTIVLRYNGPLPSSDLQTWLLTDVRLVLCFVDSLPSSCMHPAAAHLRGLTLKFVNHAMVNSLLCRMMLDTKYYTCWLKMMQKELITTRMDGRSEGGRLRNILLSIPASL
jgi:hypothetical protein